ncbi:unnamed protein product [Phytomonas sp. EM1]|nr:unnamed protein product [Phytomonas sp. EM1]|eukprot:CCW61233.1 unnamed protein product [Phytomonas sp. isolate EM1]
MMRRNIIFVQVFLLLTYLALTDALEVYVKETAVIETDHNLWKPSNAIQFSDTTFCFQTINSTFESSGSSEQLLCSFNKGSTFVIVNSSLPFCGSGGIVSDGQLYCMHEKVSRKKDSLLVYSTVVFSLQNETVVGKLSPQEVSFQPKHNIIPKEIKFNGDVQYILSEGFYGMTATVIDSSNFECPYFFKSMNGFNWTMVEPLPFNRSDVMYLQIQGDSKIAVVAKNNNNYCKVTSGDMGKSWSSIEYLNTTSPPFSVAFPSNVVAEYALSNHTPGELAFFSPLSPKNASRSFVKFSNFNQDVFNESDSSTEKSISTSYYVVSAQVSSMPLQLIVIYDEFNQGKFLLRSTLIEINDSEEKQHFEEQLIEASKKKEMEKVMNQRLKQERLRKEWKRQEIIKEAGERRRRMFAEFDRPYIDRALENMKRDKEFIVVRQVKGEFIDLESDTL